MCRPPHSSARMFLMNASPLVALQRKWGPFAQARSCRYPICFSESEDDIARTSVSTKVQMIIKNLQTEESSLDTTNEYGCILQKKRKGAKIRGHKLRRNGRMPLQEHAKYAQRSCPADSDGMEVEESSEFGLPSLNSDSDDSVDREIEEAIQEYLKNKGQSIPPLSSNAKSLPNTNTHKSLIKEHPSYDVACNVFPANVNADLIPQHLAPDFLGDDALQWTPSPCSVSSDDSFEQSIKTEIEQFLNEKRQQARKKSMSVGSKSLDQKEAQEKLAIKSQKNGSSKASPSSLKCRGKAFFLRRHPELQNTNTPPKCLMLKADQFVDFQTTSQTHLKASGASHSCILEQSNGDIGQTFWKAGGEQSAEIVDLSDSSSDDGIEEAIQLYQLEKVRKAANAQAGCIPSQKEEFGGGGLADISASLTIHSEKSALPENPRTTVSNKGKQIDSKSAELNRIGVICNESGKGRCCTSPANNFASCAVTLQTCRADTAAELMCAEAILDISKTILPPPAANDNRPLLTDPFFPSQSIPSSHQESDSNAVDSDDSIEQEIRAFLAIKAQTEHLITKSGEASNAAPNPLSSGVLSGHQIRNPKQSFPNTLKLSLGQKRKLKKESSISRQRQDKQMTLLEMGYSHLGKDNYLKPFASHEENVLNSVKNSNSGVALKKEVAPASSVDFVNPLSPGFLGTGGLLRNRREALQKYGTDDKSSSLDSDEDLDTAIKDLLRSKRKLKKKSKDQKIQCKKKVRFGNAEMHIFEDKLEVLQEKDCQSKNPTLLKSCLMKSRKNMMEEGTQEESQYTVKRRAGSTEAIQLALTFEKGCHPVSGPDNQAAAINDQHPWIAAPLMEDSSSLDSDDSIEQEIQRFLAEKAKDPSSTVNIARVFGIVDTLEAAQPPTVQSKAKRQQLEGGDVALPKQSKRAKKAHQPRAELKSLQRTEREGAENVFQTGEPTITCTENICTQVTMKCQGRCGIVQAKGASLSVKRTAVERKGVSGGKLDQKRLPSWKEKAENCKLQHYFKPMSPFKRKSPYEFKISSKFITGLRHAQKKKKSVLFRKRQSIEFSVLQSNVFRRQEGLLGERCVAPKQKEILGSKSEIQEAELCVRGMMEGPYPHVAERTEVVPSSVEVVSVVKAKHFADAEACYSAGPKHSLFLQEPSEEGAREVKVIATLSDTGREGKLQPHSNSGEEPSAPQSCSSPLKGAVLLSH